MASTAPIPTPQISKADWQILRGLTEIEQDDMEDVEDLNMSNEEEQGKAEGID